jgi:hypothetical protein
VEEARSSWKETNAFQMVGPFMKAYLDLLELAYDKKTKIESLVTVMEDLTTDKKKQQIGCLCVNSKNSIHVSCQVAHNKRKGFEITT